MKPALNYGGQAVIEGVMIRGPRFLSVACRLPKGEIDVQTEPILSFYQRHPALRRIPFLRGIFALWEMLVLGLGALERSANLQLSEEAGPPLSKGALALTLLTGFLIGIVLFLVLPRLIIGWIEPPGGDFPAGTSLAMTAERSGTTVSARPSAGPRPEPSSLRERLGLNLLEGLIRLGVFVLYIVAVTTLPPVAPEIRRVFAYHGAEHKVVNTYEAGQTVVLANAVGQSTLHRRCGTNFAFIVIVMSILVFSLLPWVQHLPWWQKLLWHVLPRLALLPLVAGLSYEVVKLAGQYGSVVPLQVLVAPGLLLQRLTTRQPDESMIEVALAAFWAVRRAEETGEILEEDADGNDPLQAPPGGGKKI